MAGEHVIENCKRRGQPFFNHSKSQELFKRRCEQQQQFRSRMSPWLRGEGAQVSGGVPRGARREESGDTHGNYKHNSK